MTFPIPRVFNGDPTDEVQYDRLADAVEYLQGVVEGGLTTITPAWGAATTSPSIGNGTLTCRYKVLGDLVYIEYDIIMGSTTTYGAGVYSLGAPHTPVGRPALLGTLRTASASYVLFAEGLGGSGFQLRQEPATGGGPLANFGQGAPVTLVSGNRVFFKGWYSI